MSDYSIDLIDQVSDSVDLISGSDEVGEPVPGSGRVL